MHTRDSGDRAVAALNNAKRDRLGDDRTATEQDGSATAATRPGTDGRSFSGRDSVASSDSEPNAEAVGSPSASADSSKSEELSGAERDRKKQRELDKIGMAIEAARRDEAEKYSEQVTEFESELDVLRRQNSEIRDALDQQKAETEAVRDQGERDLELLVSQFYRGVPVGAGRDASSSSSSRPSVTASSSSSMSVNRYRNADLLKEYKRIIEKDCVSTTVYTPTGSVIDQRDYRAADMFYQEFSKELLLAAQDELKEAGFLRGGLSSRGRDATTPADIPHAFLDLASSMGRMTHLSATVYWQFVRRLNDPSVNVEQTARFPRYEFGASSSSVADYELGSAVGALQALTESVRANTVAIEVKEYGLGKPGTALKPIAVHEVVTANNAIDAFEAINRNLVRSYNLFEDTAIRSLLHSTTRVNYVSNDGLVATDAEVAGGGQITQKSLAALHAQMSDLDIPAFSDGCYMLVMPPIAIAALQQDIIDRQRVITEPNFEELTMILNEYHGNDNLRRVTGYQGKVQGFHIFQSGTHGKGAAPGEGVQLETLNGTSVTTRSCYAFGVDPVGVVDAMPFTIRQKAESSYGRQTDFIWLAHQGYGGLDIDPLRTGASASEQLRVLEIRSADLAV